MQFIKGLINRIHNSSNFRKNRWLHTVKRCIKRTPDSSSVFDYDATIRGNNLIEHIDSGNAFANQDVGNVHTRRKGTSCVLIAWNQPTTGRRDRWAPHSTPAAVSSERTCTTSVFTLSNYVFRFPAEFWMGKPSFARRKVRVGCRERENLSSLLKIRSRMYTAHSSASKYLRLDR